MLSKSHIELIDALCDGRMATPSDLATATGRSQQHIYDALDHLVERGIVDETRGPNNQRRVTLAPVEVAETYRQLLAEFGHVEWDDLLTPALLRVCWHLDEPRRIADIADRLNVSRQSVHAALDTIKHRGLLVQNGSKYALQDSLAPLLAFSRAVVRHEHRHRVRAIAPSATIAWHDPRRILVQPHVPDDTAALDERDDWHVTGLEAFNDHDLIFFLASEPAFWYAPEPSGPTVEEVACHTLALEADSRRVSYTMLLIEVADVDRDVLKATAETYDLSETISSMLAALDGEFDESAPVTLPGEREFEALKEQYGV